MKLITCMVFALAVLGAAAKAGPVPDALKDGLDDAVGAFSDVISSGDLAGAFDYMPPEILQLLADQAGVSVDEVLDMTRRQIDTMMEQVKIETFTMDVAEADWQATPDGTRSFALIPTETVVTVEGNRTMKATSQTLAFQTGAGAWYLVRIDDADQVGLLQKAFPEFEGVEFPTGVMEMVNAGP